MGITDSKWFQILKSLGPTILGIAAPGLSPIIIPTVIHAIETAEASTSSGTEKKANAISIVNDAVTLTNSISKKQVIDPVATSTAVSSGIDAVVNGVNAVHSSGK